MLTVPVALTEKWFGSNDATPVTPVVVARGEEPPPPAEDEIVIVLPTVLTVTFEP